VRITGGEWRSRRLKGAGKIGRLRPTPDAMRERAFAVLADRVHGARFLDLWAGTGAVGLEALSRGARSVVFVERHRAAARLIHENAAAFDLAPDRAELMIRPALAALKELQQRGDEFDLAWADPPFEDWREGLEVTVRLFESGQLHDDSLACLECPARVDLAAVLPPKLRVVRDLAGGASRVVMIEEADR
jgi:16S rRNA (guanine(966)-N(2))-methyltransferase RsmD